MDMSKLNSLPKEDIVKMAELCHLDTTRSTAHLVKELTTIFKQVEEKKNRYTRISQLGAKGKEGTVFLVANRTGAQYAMKTFASTKSDRNLEKEAVLLGKAAEFHISPPLIEYDLHDNFIVMEKLEGNLFDYLRDHKGKMPTRMQKEMIDIFKTLDRIQIFHADPNPLNFMFDAKGKLKIIDFGFAKAIDDKLAREHDTREVNMRFMPLGFLLKMRDLVPPTNFPYLLKHVAEEDQVHVLNIAPPPPNPPVSSSSKTTKSIKRKVVIAKEPTKDKARESTKDKARESTKDKTKESTKDKTKESTKDKTKQSTKDRAKESTKDKTKESTKTKEKKTRKARSKKV